METAFEGFEAFFHAERSRLIGSLTLFLGDRASAEELADEALVRACERWGVVRTMAAPGAWVHRVAMNLAKSRLRRQVVALRVRRRLSRDRDGVTTDLGDSVEVIALRNALRELPMRQREVLIHRYYRGLPVMQVAHAMDCSEAAVKSLTHRAMVALRHDLEVAK